MLIQLLYMCNWHKNRKNFEKRSRKHFFFCFWMLTCVAFPIWKTKVERTCHLLDFWSVTTGICHMAFAINFTRINAELGSIGHRVYGLSNANDFPWIFVHFRGVFPYILCFHCKAFLKSDTMGRLTRCLSFICCIGLVNAFSAECCRRVPLA